MQSIITFSDVSFETPNGNSLFQHLNFSLGAQVTALVGPNGVGKTTLAKLIVGELEATRGRIHRHGGVSYFSQREVPPEVSVNEYLAEDYEWSKLSESLLDGLDREKLCSQLSGGQWMRVRLARTLKDQFLILDEPTNDLDTSGRQVLLQFLRSYRAGILLISHDREALGLCDQVLELSNQGLSRIGNGWEDYELSKTHERENLRDQLDIAKNHREQVKRERVEKLDKQEKRNRQGQKVADRGGMPKILIGARKRRAQVSLGKVDVATMEKANLGVREAYEAFQHLKVDPIMYADLQGAPIPQQKLVAQAQDFNIRFRDWLYPRPLNFSWRGNIRLALTGANGSGKSSLIKALLGQKFEIRGELKTGNLKTLYVDQRCDILTENASVLDNIREVAHLDESEIRNGLAKFLFMKDAVFQTVNSLSGGERLRAALAKGLLANEKPDLLILDEPTNNLDLVNIEFLENLVCGFQGAFILISHDSVFRKKCGITEEYVLGGDS